MTGRSGNILAALGLALLLIGVFLPTAWYDELPRREDMPDPPIKGVTLIRICFLLEGVVLLAASRRRAPGTTALGEALVKPPADSPGRWTVLWVAVATGLGAALRFYRIGSDLWVDEITTIFDYENVSAFHILTAYTSSNNHLLNTLAVKAMSQWFGAEEWAIRLPAVLLGAASVPAIYFLARIALPRSEAILASLLLAVSYHHIFFSQNARGYTGWLFWSILGTTLFFKAVATDRTRYWALYVATMLLSVATLLNSFFIIAGHGVTSLWICLVLYRRGVSPIPFIKRMAIVWAVLGLLSFHLYASIIPQVYVYLHATYSEGSGFSPFSWEYLEEMRRGLSVGFRGGTTAALAALSVFGLGLLSFLRRNTTYCVALISPLVVTAAFLLSQGLLFSPRFFLWGIPVAFIFTPVFVGKLGPAMEALQRRWGVPVGRLAPILPAAAAILLLSLSLLSLPRYYATPKQPNRQALEWLRANRSPGDVVAGVYLAKWGMSFYGPRLGVDIADVSIRSMEAMHAVEQQGSGGNVWLMVTFPRAQRLLYPELSRYIAERYQRVERFPASVGDGEIEIWKRASP